MEKPKSQSRHVRRSAKLHTTSASAAAKGLIQKADGGSGRASSASGSIIVESSPSRSSTPDVAPALPSSTALPKYRYTREELLNLMNSPLSKIKPELCLSIRKLFDGSAREAESSALDEQASMRQAMAIRKHLNLGGEPQSLVNQVNTNHDGDQHVVLVPRRLSFSTGCHVSSSGSVNSPELKRERIRRDGHRIGSGRIQISEKRLERELRDHRALCDREQDHEDRRFDRNGGGSSGLKVLKRDYEGRRQEGGRGGRYVGGSRSGREEPEWFTDGPVSQSDTIELWGFDQGHSSRSSLRDLGSSDVGGSDVGDDISKLKPTTVQSAEVDVGEAVAKESVAKEPVAKKPVAKEPGRNDSDFCSSVVDEIGDKDSCAPSAEKNSPLKSAPLSGQPTCESENNRTPDGVQQLQASLSPPPALNPLQNADAELDFNAIFNIDTIPGLSEMFGLEPEQSKSGGSRFKQWFHFSSHGNSHCGESRRSSLTDEFGYINDIICGHGSPPGTSSPPLMQPAYGSTLCSAEKCSAETQNLLELLQKAHGDTIDADFRSSAVRNGSALHGALVRPAADSANPGFSFNHVAQNSIDSKVDAKAVEAGLKAILSGSVLSDSLLSTHPSMAHFGSLTAGPPPSGAKVLLAEELEARLVTASSDRSESSRAATASSLSRPSNCRTPADKSLTPPRLKSWSNSGNLSFCSLPVLPVGTKVTMLSDLEAGLRGLGVTGRAATGCQPRDGNADGNPSATATSRPVSSHNSAANPAVLAASAFPGRMTDLAAYRKLLGLVMDPCVGYTAVDNALPIVTSPTSASMSSLEANQPNDSFANNQRDFIQRYVLQQQQLKMLNHSQPHKSEGIGLAPSGIPTHIMPAEVPHPLYMTPGPFVDRVPSVEAMTPPGQGANVPPLLDSSVYGRPRAGPSLNLPPEDDLALLSGGLSPEFCGGHFVGSRVLRNNNGQLCQSTARGGGEGLPTDGRGLLQCLESVGCKQLSGHAKHLLQYPMANHAVASHNAVLLNQHQQAAKMMHLAVQDKFTNSVKAGLSRPVNQSPIPPHHLTLQPPVAHHPAAVTTLPSPGIPILAPQTLLQQPPQSPRRAPSPLMFGSQAPMNLTAPLPVHLGPLTPILSPTLSPNTLQVTQQGSNLSSPVMRVPSPQELSGLAQSILQNALIKKQLEEQKERFVKRQQERNKSPKAHTSMPAAVLTASSSKSSLGTSASTTVVNSDVMEAGKTLPSSFLPTSVLRKMVNTKMEEKLTGRIGEGEKNVPLLKVVKPDEEEEAEADVEKDSKMDPNSFMNPDGPNSTTDLIPDNLSSEMSAKCEFTEDKHARQQDVVSSVDSGNRLSLDEGALRPSSARRLVGQGLMNLNSSAALVDEPSAAPVVAGFVPSGRQIKGTKLPEHLPVSLPPASGVVRNKVGYHPSALRQQQPPFLMGNSSNGRGGVGASVNALHALEMAKILEQQNMGLVSPVPILPPSAPPPPDVTRFVPSLPAENGAVGVKQFPRMMVQPPFGLNSSASNALLLQRLGRSNLQRAALSSVNQLNLNQLALIQAIQFQTQQQQQMWNRSSVRPLANSRPTCPAFLPSNQPPAHLSSCLSTNNASSADGFSRQNGSVMVNSAMAPFDGSNSGQNPSIAKFDGENAGRSQIAEMTSAPVASGLGHNVVTNSNQLIVTSVGDGCHQLPDVRHDHPMDGNLAKWFGSDVFHQSMPPLLAPVGQKVLTVDEIECWQHAVSKS